MTLRDIQARRDDALRDVRVSGAKIKKLGRGLFEPPAESSRLGNVFSNFDKLVAIYDGVMLGVKVISRVRRAVRRRR